MQTNGHHGIFKFTHFVENIKKAALDIGEASVNNESMNAVRIMTMHKSKGLQFPVVFVSGLGKSVKSHGGKRQGYNQFGLWCRN